MTNIERRVSNIHTGAQLDEMQFQCEVTMNPNDITLITIELGFQSRSVETISL